MGGEKTAAPFFEKERERAVSLAGRSSDRFWLFSLMLAHREDQSERSGGRKRGRGRSLSFVSFAAGGGSNAFSLTGARPTESGKK